MAQSPVQYQRALSMPEFFDRYASPQQCEDLVRARHWPDEFVCPRCQGRWHSEFRRQDRAYFQCGAPVPMQPGQRHDLRVEQGSAAVLVLDHAPDDAGQEQRHGARTQAPPGCVLPHGLAASAQDHAGDDTARSGAPAHRAGRDRRCLPRWRGPGRQVRPRLAEPDRHDFCVIALPVALNHRTAYEYQ
jgi:hypothetical protein